MMLWIFLIFTVLAYVYFKLKRNYSYWKERGVDYVKPKPFVGSMQIIRSKSFAEQSKEIYDQFPEKRYHGAYIFSDPILVIKDPDLIKQVTVKEFDHFVDHRTIVSSEIDPIWAKNLVNLQGERWRDLRATLSPSFTSSKMKIMYTLIDDCARQFVEFFKSDSSEVVELEMKDTFSRYTNDVVATIAFGLKCDSLKNKNNDFYMMGKDVTSFTGLRFLRFFANLISPTLCKLFKVKVIPTYIASFFSNIIEETVKTRKEKNIIRPDMIHLLMAAQKGRQHYEEDSKINEGFSSVSESELTKNRRKEEITLEDIIAQAFIFFLAGFETVSNLLTFSFYELAINPDIQDRLRKEINNVPELTYETLMGMKYLDMVVSEALRKWAPGIITDRKVTKPFTIQPKLPGEKPLLLEEGLILWLPLYAIHRDPKHYPDPEKFDPERFSDENKHKINSAVYLPFGAGPRNCIGSRFALLEAKLIFYHVLKNFEIVPIKKTKIPVEFDPKQFGLFAKGGMWLGFKKIN